MMISLERANQLRDLGRWFDAEPLYAELLRQEPGNADVRVGHALNLMASGDMNGAAAELTEVLLAMPGRAEARYHRSVCYAMTGRDDEALADLDRLLADGSNDWYLWTDRGALLARSGNFTEAISSIRTGLRIEPTEPVAHFNLGCVLADTGDLDEAYTELALAAQGGLSIARKTRDRVRRQIAQRIDEAGTVAVLELLRRDPAVEAVTELANQRPYLLDPEFQKKLVTAANSHTRQARRKDRQWIEILKRLAVPEPGEINRADQSEPLRPDADPADLTRYERLSERLNLLHQRGHAQGASALARDLVMLASQLYGDESSQYGKRLMNLAIFEARDGLWADAEGKIQRAFDILAQADPAALPDGLASYAAVLSDAGDAEEAVAACQLAVSVMLRLPRRIRHETAARVYKGLGRSMLELGAAAQAEEILRAGLTQDWFSTDDASDSLATILNTLAEVVFELDRLTEAIELCRQALALRRKAHGELHPAVAEAMRNLGRAYNIAGDVGAAHRWLDRSARVWQQLAGEAADPAEEGLTYGDLAQLYAAAGSGAEARAAAARALAAVERLSHTLNKQVTYILGQVRDTFRTLGDLDAELAAQEQLISEAERRRQGRPASEQLNMLADIHFRRKEYDQARRYYAQALEIISSEEPENHEVIAVLQHNLANIMADARQYDPAIEMHERSLAGFRKVWPLDDPRLLGVILELAELYFDAGQLSGAERLLSEARPFLGGHAALEARGAALAMQLSKGADTAGLTPAIAQIGRLARDAGEALDSGNLEQAERLYQEVMDIAVANLGPKDAETATSIFNLAVVRRKRGQLAGVPDLLREALSIRQEKLSSGDVRTANARLELADVLREMGHDPEATELATQVVQDATDGLASSLLGRAHTILGLILHRRHDLRGSQQHLQEAMRIADEAGDPENRVSSRRNLALLLMDAGEPDDASQLVEDAYQLSVHYFGPDSPAAAIASLSRVKQLRFRGRYAEADPLAREALERLEPAYPTGHPAVTDALNEVGLALYGQGMPERAESFFEKAIAAASLENLGREAALMLNQAGVFAELGHADRSVLLAQDAAERIATRSGSGEIQHGSALARLGSFEYQAGHRSAALQHLTQAFRIIESAAGSQSPELLDPLHDLAHIYVAIGARRTALAFARRAHGIARTAYGPAHPALGRHLVTLARCLAVTGNTAEAIQLSLAAADISPTMTGIVRWLAWLWAATGNRTQALAMLERVIVLEDTQMAGVLELASEEHRNAYSASLWQTVSQYLTLVSDDEASADFSLKRRAWELVMRRRALNGEYLRFEREAALGSDRPELANYLRELADVRANLARAITKEDTGEADRLRQRRTELERLLASLLPADSRRAWLGPVNAEKVIAALPPKTTLIEFARIDTTDFANLALGIHGKASRDDPLRTKPRQRYLAFAAEAGEHAVIQLIDLGPAEPIEREMAAQRAHLTSPARGFSPPQPGTEPEQALRQLLVEPLHDLLHPGQQLVVIADGDIGRVPLQVLPSGNGHRLIDDHLITYISSSREVLRWNARALKAPASPALILADPDYDLGAPLDMDSPGLRRLPATLQEAQEIGTLLAVQPLTGPAAAKISLEEARSPMVVHLATHGLYLPAETLQAHENYAKTLHIVEVPSEGMFLSQPDRDLRDDRQPDSLLRSGVALAGYNQWLNGAVVSAETGNGMLTADEVCSLHLRGTRLVTLSACDTGLGDLRQSEGLVGLRWAFGVAGAMTIVSSMWQVADRQTQELMTEFYQQLLAGLTIPAALRAAQLVLSGRYADPFWWGAFVCHGDPRVALL